MEEKNKSNVLMEIELLLREYFSEKEASEFQQSLRSSVLVYNTVENKENLSLDTEQIDFKIPTGTDERELVTLITTFAESKLPKENLLKFLLDLAQLMTFKGEINIATELSEDVISKTENEHNLETYRADAFLSLARIAWSQAYWDQSLEYVKVSYKIFAKIENKEGFAKCENMLATIYGEKGEIIKALKHLANALLFLSDSDNIELRAMIEVNLGILYSMQGEIKKALWNLKNGLEKYEMLGDTRRIARVHHNLGMLQAKIGDYQAALEEFNKSIIISTEYGYLSNCALSYIGKAHIYTKLQNAALADVFTDKAMEIACKINDSLSIADIYKIKAMIQSELENYELSEELFENSIRLNDDLESNFNKAETCDELSQLYDKLNQKLKSHILKQSANSYFQKILPSENS